jgi:hypothetical protein
VSDRPDPGSSEPAKVFAEAVEVLLTGYLPDDARAHLDGSHPSPSPTPYELNQLQVRALRQAGVEAGQIEARILKVEVDQLRRDIERLERTQEAQDKSSLSEGRVYAIVIAALGALVTMVALLGFITGKF